jgi:hypothetical protein
MTTELTRPHIRGLYGAKPHVKARVITGDRGEPWDAWQLMSSSLQVRSRALTFTMQ